MSDIILVEKIEDPRWEGCYITGFHDHKVMDNIALRGYVVRQADGDFDFGGLYALEVDEDYSAQNSPHQWNEDDMVDLAFTYEGDPIWIREVRSIVKSYFAHI